MAARAIQVHSPLGPRFTLRVIAIAWTAVIAAGLVAANPSIAHARSFALLVAVGKQPTAGVASEGHRPLKGTTNDVKNLRQLLIREYGFQEGDITILIDSQATLEAVRAEFNRLRSAAGPGDVVVFHYAGHGTSIPDDNGDELVAEPGDVMDEALCLYDCGPDMKRALRDDELGQLLDQQQAERVVVILDCCHSGTATRSLDSVPRFGAARYQPARLDNSPPRSSQPPKDLPVTRSSTGDIRNARQGQRRVVFSACTAVQQSCEIMPIPQLPEIQCGSLTYFLVEGMRGPADTDGNGQVSFLEAQQYALRRIDSLYNGAQENDRLRQTPQLEATPAEEGEGPIFGVEKKVPVHAVISAGNAADLVQLDLGVIHGMKIGQRLALFPFVNGQPRLGEPIGDLEIKSLEAEAGEAQLRAGAFGVAGAPLAAAPLVDPLAKPDVRLHLRVKRDEGGRIPSVANSLAIGLTGRLVEEPRMRLVEDAAELELVVEQTVVAQGRVEVSLVLWDESRREQRREPVSLETVTGLDQVEKIRFPDESVKFVTATIEWMRGVIAEYRLRKLVGGLTNPAPSFQVQLASNRKALEGALMPEFQVRDRVKIAVKSTADCWIYLLAISPSGKIDVWYESTSGSPPLEANQPKLFPGPGKFFLPSEPGVYQMKLIATRQRLQWPLVREGKLDADELRSRLPADWSESSYPFRVLAAKE
ncbi:MAG: caspase family protein [Pirellulales bacterium]